KGYNDAAIFYPTLPKAGEKGFPRLWFRSPRNRNKKGAESERTAIKSSHPWAFPWWRQVSKRVTRSEIISRHSPYVQETRATVLTDTCKRLAHTYALLNLFKKPIHSWDHLCWICFCVFTMVEGMFY